MDISLKQLLQFLPQIFLEDKEFQILFDDVGLEVKRVQSHHGDTIFTLELLANRGDHMSYVGVARELAGRLGCQIKLPIFNDLIKGSSLTPVQVICDSDLCYQYSATLVELTSNKLMKLPGNDEYLLKVAGVNVVNPSVDLTNLTNILLGQSTHVFDADKVNGPIHIRLSKKEEKALLLFEEKPIILPEGLLVIADDQKILAVAGVIGCDDSKVDENTKRIIIEAATFDPVIVRKGSSALKIRTASSARFEKGADPSLMLEGVGFILHKLKSYGLVKKFYQPQVIRKKDFHSTVITISLNRIRKYFSLSKITREEIINRLEKYGFICCSQNEDALSFEVPLFRFWEVLSPEDLYEELARSIGYDNLPGTLPIVSVGTAPSVEEKIKNKINQLLINYGFYEIFTNGFYGQDLIDKMKIQDDQVLEHIEVINAQDKGFSLLKRYCLPQGLAMVLQNLHLKKKDIKTFEWSHVFVPNQSAANGLCDEKRKLWTIINGNDKALSWNHSQNCLDIWYLKGIVQEVSHLLNFKCDFDLSDETEGLMFLHPYRRSTVRVKDEVVGYFGEVHPTLCQNFGIKRERPCYLELDFDQLLEIGRLFMPPQEVETSTLLPLTRMLSFVVPNFVEAEKIIEVFSSVKNDLLEHVEIGDLYSFDDQGVKKRSITYELEYKNETGKPVSEEINQLTNTLIEAVHLQLGPLGVVLKT